MKLALALMLTLLAGAAHAQAVILHPSKKLGGYQVQISALDSKKSWISIQMMDLSGRVVSPGSVPLTAAYAARNVPFTPIPLEIRGNDSVGYIPVPKGENYTVQLRFKSGRTTFNPRFFINRSLKTGN